MNAPTSLRMRSAPDSERGRCDIRQDTRPLVSLVLPAYNEAALLERSLQRLCEYMRGLEDRFRWEIVLINDGSTDGTAEIAEEFSRRQPNVRVYHHITNFGLGQAFKFAFRHCRGDYVLTLDADLSYDVGHIERLLERIVVSQARIVVASPYMEGGEISSVPWLRRNLSIGANRFLAATSQSGLSTLTSMVRVYDGRFLRSLHLRSTGMEIIPEIIYKARLLGGRIEEIPAHLDWSLLQETPGRRSGMRLWRHSMRVILSGFLFRPVVFFILPGLLILLFSIYANGWVVSHFLDAFAQATQYTSFFERSSAALSAAFALAPHSFIVGIASLMVAIQLISLGILSLQSKSYFEELFHLGSTIFRTTSESNAHTETDRRSKSSE